MGATEPADRRASTDDAPAPVEPPVPATPPEATKRRFSRDQLLAPFSTPTFKYLWLNTFGFALIQSTERFTFVWLVLQLGGGPSGAGLVAFALGIPVLFLSLPAGVLSDRMSRRQLLLWSQATALVLTGATAALVWSGRITIPLAYALAAGIGATTAFGRPVRQAIVPSIVEASRLQNAVALMTLGMNTSLIIGPAFGGGIIALTGLAWAFVLQTVLYALTLLPLLPLRLPKIVREEGRPGRELLDGLAFILRRPGIRTLVGLLMLSGLFMIGPFQALLPHIAEAELGTGAFGASMLFVALGAGMLVTSILLAAARNIRRKGMWFMTNLIGGGVIWAGVGLSDAYALTFVLMLAWGLGGGLFINLNQTLIQLNTPDRLMGRVMSVHTLAFQGVGPLGALIAGGAADAIGATSWVTACGAAIAVAAALGLLTQPGLRRMT